MTAERLEELARKCEEALTADTMAYYEGLGTEEIYDLAQCAREYGQQLWRIQGPLWMKCPTCKKNGFRRNDVWEPFY